VNDTTSSPEESGDRTGVAKGRQAGSPDPAAKDAPPPDRNGAAGAGSTAGNPPPSGAADGSGRDAASGAVDGPTARIRLPKATNGSGREQQPTGPATVNSMPTGSSGAPPDSGPEPAAPTAGAADGVNPTAGAPGRGKRVTDPGATSSPRPGPGSEAGAPDAAGPAPDRPAAAAKPGAPPPRPQATGPTAPKPQATGPTAPKPAGTGPIPGTGPTPIARGIGRPSTGGSTRPAPDPRTPADPEPVLAAAAMAPSTGPVPTPGPAAASPPPWNRVPGRTPHPAEQPASAHPSAGPVGDLLDDGPTAYLMPDSGSTTDVTEPQVKGRSPVRSGRTRPPRRAALQLKRLDPWSMLKLGLVLAVVIFFIWLVAVGVLYGVLDGMGVWDRLNGTYADLVSGEPTTGSPLISAGRVFGLAAVIGAINSLLFAVAVTIGAFVYNVSADLVGGVEVTLSERD
jgi:Transmembrane domain of unknown function (DUF3566)